MRVSSARHDIKLVRGEEDAGEEGGRGGMLFEGTRRLLLRGGRAFVVLVVLDGGGLDEAERDRGRSSQLGEEVGVVQVDGGLVVERHQHVAFRQRRVALGAARAVRPVDAAGEARAPAQLVVERDELEPVRRRRPQVVQRREAHHRRRRLPVVALEVREVRELFCGEFLFRGGRLFRRRGVFFRRALRCLFSGGVFFSWRSVFL
mmetsp:Transcript_24484/g.75630  ORF Transcript_24484/g.75630 Transcript_24484/m.75630 type:complete len:204 (+) Transcript_24484:378-989(+)